MMDEEAARADIVALCRRVYEKGWVANHDGNLSVRVGGDRVIATPTSISKGEVRPEHLIAVDLHGSKLEGTRRGFSEFSLHLAVYRSRPDVHAVIHAHPRAVAGFAVAGIEVDPTFMPEAVVSIGDRVPMTRFALPYGDEGAAPLKEYVDDYDVLMMQNHGILGYGPDLWTAFYRIELVEHLAGIQLVATQLGEVRRLGDAQIERLLEKRKKAGLGPEARGRSHPSRDARAPLGDGASQESRSPEPFAARLPNGAAPSAWTGGEGDLHADGASGGPCSAGLPDDVTYRAGAGGGPDVQSSSHHPASCPSNEQLRALVDRELERVLGK